MSEEGLQCAYFVSADWSKLASKRSVHVADLAERRIWWEERDGWDLEGLLDLARELGRRGPVLIGLDMVFGVPTGYWQRVLGVKRWRECGTFVDWLGTIDPASDFFETVFKAKKWRAEQPFFHVPKGKGGLNSFKDRVAGGLLRSIDKRTGAKPMFAVSGIPGTVGSGTRDLWMELIPLLNEDRDFAVWPFEGSLESLLETRRIVLAESYPGLAYAVVLAESLPTHRLVVAKTQPGPRERACDLLEKVRWVRDAGVDLGGLGPARADEDPFDSQFTAAAVLRCLIEGVPLCDPAWIDSTAEGAMLMAGPVNVERRGKRLVVEGHATPRRTRPKGDRRRRAAKKKTSASRERRDYPCPIPGCTKVFRDGRNGWDSHVHSLRMHADWHPGVRDPVERKRLFREEFGEWFR